MEDALKLKFLEADEGSATPFFVIEVLVFQVIEVNCVRLGVLLLAKLNLLCLKMLVATFFWSSTNSELNFCKIRNLPSFGNPSSATEMVVIGPMSRLRSGGLQIKVSS